MQAPRQELLPPPPGIVRSLKAGFDTIALHLTAMLLPLGVDLLLWLGPRLSVKEYYESILPQFERDWLSLGFSAQQVQTTMEAYRAQVSSLDALNLLALLRTFPIGITSLLSGPSPEMTPLGAPLVLQVGPLGNIFLLMLAIVLAGWIGGALYYLWVASLVLPEGETIRGRALWQSVALSFLAAVVMVAVGLPVFLIIYVLSALSPAVGQAAVLILGFAAIWLVVPLFFAGHGIFLRKQNVFASLVSGVQLARFSLPNSSLFVLTVLFIGFGLNYLWRIPEPDSWMLLVGILGHAFITTALLAGSFIYYRDMTAWLKIVFEHLQVGTTKA